MADRRVKNFGPPMPLANYAPQWRALVFEPATWAACEEVAAAKGQTATQMIVTAVAGCFGTIHEDNYALNRFLSVDDP